MSSPAAHEKRNRLPEFSTALSLPRAAAGTAALRRIKARAVRGGVGGRGSSGSRRRRWCRQKEIATSAIQRGRRKMPRWLCQPRRVSVKQPSLPTIEKVLHLSPNLRAVAVESNQRSQEYRLHPTNLSQVNELQKTFYCNRLGRHQEKIG